MDQNFSAIEHLPDEILLIIFRNIKGHHLGVSVSKVCRRWKRLISYYVLRIQHPGDDKKIHRGLLALLVTSYEPALPDASSIITQVTLMLPHLKELTVSVEYCLGFLRKLENHNGVFKQFHMYGRSVYYPSKEMVKFLYQHSVNLTELTLRCADLVDARYEVIGLCTGLTSLQLYSCLQMTLVGAIHLTNLVQLRCLHATGMRMMRTTPLFDFIQRLPCHIDELNLSHSWFGDEHCSALVARLPKLRSLELWRSRISAIYLLQLTKLLTSLEDLDTDVLFVPSNIGSLNEHGSLKNVRCRWNGQIMPRFHMTSALETIPIQFLRQDEEGPRSELFYYWTQGVPIHNSPALPPIPMKLFPNWS